MGFARYGTFNGKPSYLLWSETEIASWPSFWVDDWICLLFSHLSPSNALALTSLFFLHLGWVPINAIEVTFLLAWSCGLTQGFLRKWSFFFFLCSKWPAHLISLSQHRWFFYSIPDMQKGLVQSETFCAVRDCLLNSKTQPSFLFVSNKLGSSGSRLWIRFFSPSNQTSLPKILIPPPRSVHPHWSRLVWLSKACPHWNWGYLSLSLLSTCFNLRPFFYHLDYHLDWWIPVNSELTRTVKLISHF